MYIIYPHGYLLASETKLVSGYLAEDFNQYPFAEGILLGGALNE